MTTLTKEVPCAGPEYPYGPMPCQARVQLQQVGELTVGELERTVAGVAAGYNRLTKVCRALGGLTRPTQMGAVSAQTQKQLHVFCNPLFGAT